MSIYISCIIIFIMLYLSLIIFNIILYMFFNKNNSNRNLLITHNDKLIIIQLNNQMEVVKHMDIMEKVSL